MYGRVNSGECERDKKGEKKRKKKLQPTIQGRHTNKKKLLEAQYWMDPRMRSMVMEE